MTRSIGTPGAVLIGSGLIALAVFLGLRSRPEVVVAATGSASAAGPASAPQQPPRASTSAESVAMAAAGAPPASPLNVDADTLAAIDKQRAMLVESCWKPSTDGGAAPATYEIDIAFDASGRQVGRGFSGRHGANSALTQCLYLRSPPLVIPSRGVPTHAHVSFTLP